MGSSTNQNFNAGASDSALSVVSSQGVTTARDSGIALGNQAKLNTGLEVGSLSGSAQLTINNTDSGLGQTFADTIKSVTESNTAALAAVVQNSARANLPSATDLPPGDVTAGADKPTDTTTKPDPLLLGGLAIGAALAIWFFFLRK